MNIVYRKVENAHIFDIFRHGENPDLEVRLTDEWDRGLEIEIVKYDNRQAEALARILDKAQSIRVALAGSTYSAAERSELEFDIFKSTVIIYRDGTIVGIG